MVRTDIRHLLHPPWFSLQTCIWRGASRTYMTVVFEVAEALLRKAAGVHRGIH
jgi:hypothetical protein